MKITKYFDLLPDQLLLDTWISAPKRPELLELSGALLKKFKRDFLSTSNDPSETGYPFFSNRIYNAGMYVMPFLTEALDTRGMRALEIGSGPGGYSAILSHAFREYAGVDLSAETVRAAEQFCAGFGATNVHFFADEAANLEKFLARQPGKFDLIILHAVIEHLLPEERFSVLRTCWEYLDDGGYLFIGEAPNSIYHVDLHSSLMLYFQQMPIEMWEYFYEASDHENWKDAIRSGIEENSLRLNAFRWGVAVGFREFEKGLGVPDIATLRAHVVADNYDVFMMNRFNFTRFDFLKLCEIRQMRQNAKRTDREYRDLPDLFSRHYLEVLLRKQPLEKFPTDWTAISVDDSPHGTSEMVVEGKDIDPRSPLLFDLPAGLAKHQGPVDVMLQVLKPGDSGILTVETQAGTQIFERLLWRSMRHVSEFRDKMMYRLPPLAASDFPIKLSAQKGKVRLSYVLMRRQSRNEASAGQGTGTNENR
jgi:SAM-dependent methyltransferase